ncbi:MAG: PIN domain-containing protein [Candidatus Electrothrix sp. AW2]|nr:PIN domain-containing protein [Candidatus Electrothrix sp. AX1]MCI5117339.1 PIN domain-containing protein [Candidatus Electrothrix gigas]MCI5128818.1 PIN domain-containing protein [Candidatus Electrothrix gigas]MCI5135152.1 PIN domain-containing protein [Candidatus Electrothrix gigas]MCI5177771.1 PIN domain-containing protein [Candidatus Electrothrix gigas]
MNVYLDNCCMNRLFDDQSNRRVRFESEAVKVILSFCDQRRWHNIAQFEVEQIPDEERRKKLQLLMGQTDEVVKIDKTISLRAKELEEQGIQAFDALHLACAEDGADVFLTVDDNLLKQALGIEDLKVSVNNPVVWLMKEGIA